MMLANMLCCQVQAVDLRWLQRQVESDLDELLPRYGVDPSNTLLSIAPPWYKFALQPRAAAAELQQHLVFDDTEFNEFISELVDHMDDLTTRMKTNECYSEVYQALGQGKRFQQAYFTLWVVYSV